jgi:endonuclease/exonuclease/phosphatase family metal-dependent hydrolase
MLLLYIFTFLLIVIAFVAFKKISLKKRHGLKIMTWNVQDLFTQGTFPPDYKEKVTYENAELHLFLVANMIATINPDVCILQEVGGAYNLEILNIMIRNKYKLSYNQYIDDMTGTQYQSAVLSKYKMDNIKGMGKSIYARMPFLGSHLHILGVHLDDHIIDYWKRGDKMTIKKHNRILMKELYPLVEMANSFSTIDNEYVMMAGDFNTFYGSNPLKLIDITKWINLMYSKKFEQGIHNNYTHWIDTDENKKMVIDEVTDVDHIYVNKKLFDSTLTCQVGHFSNPLNDPRYNTTKERKISDHYPLVMFLQFDQ